MDEQRERILIIDDDRELCCLLSEYLSPENFIVDAVFNGQDGLDMAVGDKYRLIILDVMLPGTLNGFNILQLIRAKTTVPVLMLSARGDDIDRIVGLEMGADDYLPKPFNPRELLARIRTIIRRSASAQPVIEGNHGAVHRVGDLELNEGARQVKCAGNPIDLTSVEFDLLKQLARNAGQILSRDRLASDVLGRALSPYDRSIDVHISKLRKKIGHHRIKSIRGSGYVYTAVIPPPEAPPSLPAGGESS